MQIPILIKANALPLNEVCLFRLPRQRYFRKLSSAIEIKETDKVPKELIGKIVVNFSNNQHACRQMTLSPEQDVIILCNEN